MIYKESQLQIYGKNNYKVSLVKCIGGLKTNNSKPAYLYDIVSVVSKDPVVIKKLLKNKKMKALLVGLAFPQIAKNGHWQRFSKNLAVLLKPDLAAVDSHTIRMPRGVKMVLLKQKKVNHFALFCS